MRAHTTWTVIHPFCTVAGRYFLHFTLQPPNRWQTCTHHHALGRLVPQPRQPAKGGLVGQVAHAKRLLGAGGGGAVGGGCRAGACPPISGGCTTTTTTQVQAMNGAHGMARCVRGCPVEPASVVSIWQQGRPAAAASGAAANLAVAAGVRSPAQLTNTTPRTPRPYRSPYAMRGSAPGTTGTRMTRGSSCSR